MPTVTACHARSTSSADAPAAAPSPDDVEVSAVRPGGDGPVAGHERRSDVQRRRDHDAVGWVAVEFVEVGCSDRHVSRHGQLDESLRGDDIPPPSAGRPVEFDATRRAKAILAETGMIRAGEEEKGMSAVLDAAAWTYVAAFITSLAYFLYYLLPLLGGNRN